MVKEVMNDKDLLEKVGQAIGEIFENQRLERVHKNKILNQYAKEGAVLFTGSSLMEHFPVEELSLAEGIDKIIYNRGVGGFTTDDFLKNIDTMLLDYKAGKVFINIGTNDISENIGSNGKWLEHLTLNYDKILSILKEKQPDCEVYLMAYYPSNMDVIHQSELGAMAFGIRTLENIELANRSVEALAEKFGYHYINVNEGLTDCAGNLKAEFTTDGVHMTPNAYAVILRNMKMYI